MGLSRLCFPNESHFFTRCVCTSFCELSGNSESTFAWCDDDTRRKESNYFQLSMCTSVNSCLLFKLFPVAGLYCGIRKVEQQQAQRNKKQKTRERERERSATKIKMLILTVRSNNWLAIRNEPRWYWEKNEFCAKIEAKANDWDYAFDTHYSPL